MEIIALGAVGELVGGLAVLVTLIYLALQVRQSNHIAQDSSSRVFNETVFALCTDVAGDRALAETWSRGGDHFDELDAIDRQRLILFEWRALDVWHLAFQQHQAGIMNDVQWNKALFNIELMGARQALREAWKVYRTGYDEAFRNLADPYLGFPAEGR